MFSDYLANKILDHLLGGPDYVRPATIHIGVHLATTLQTGAAAGQNQIVVMDDVAVGAQVVINPLGPTSETFAVTAKAGAGPYTLTLSGNLANPWVAGTAVKFRSAAAVKEPAGGAYARVAVVNNAANFPAAAARAKSNGAAVVFPKATLDWGLVTEMLLFDAAAGGNLLARATPPGPVLVQANTTLSIPVGDLDFEVT
jgi:hypothetical protein